MISGITPKLKDDIFMVILANYLCTKLYVFGLNVRGCGRVLFSLILA